MNGIFPSAIAFALLHFVMIFVMFGTEYQYSDVTEIIYLFMVIHGIISGLFIKTDKAKKAAAGAFLSLGIAVILIIILNMTVGIYDIIIFPNGQDDDNYMSFINSAALTITIAADFSVSFISMLITAMCRSTDKT